MVPGLKKSPQEVAGALTLIGFMLDGFEEVSYQGKKDYLFGLEIRQNRPDCLSTIGLAKEVAAYYGLKVKLPEATLPKNSKRPLNIKVDEKEYVKKIIAVKIKNLKNSESPDWLKEYLSLFDINSINFLVDISNYVMFLTGYPSHLFDADKLSGDIVWSLNKEFDQIVTLDGSLIPLNKNELIIKDSKNILGLAGIVGGELAKLDLKTESILLETAVYDHTIIRNNSRDLSTVTEASNRLTKNLDPLGLDYSAGLLISMILENCGGELESRVFNYSPQKEKVSKIKFDLKLPSVYAGVDISEKKSKDILKNLGFEVKENGKSVIVTPPIGRKDVSLPEDLVEEVIRVFGYDQIPPEETPKLEVVQNITPKNISLAEKIRDILPSLGFDEVLSWPLTKKGQNERANYLKWESVTTENSINEDYPELRQSTVIGLIDFSKEHLKKNIKYVKLFEIGKVFGKNKNYEEYEAVGIFLSPATKEEKLSDFKAVVEGLLRTLGLIDVSYQESKNKPKLANSYSCWDIFSGSKFIGIIYKLKPEEFDREAYFAEFDFDKILDVLDKTESKSTIELNQKLIVLDANIELKEEESLFKHLGSVKKKIGNKNIWGINVVDEFSLKDKIRYTVRVSYMGLSDQEAKKIHAETFDA